jgi:hypothetical protein
MRVPDDASDTLPNYQADNEQGRYSGPVYAFYIMMRRYRQALILT